METCWRVLGPDSWDLDESPKECQGPRAESWGPSVGRWVAVGTLEGSLRRSSGSVGGGRGGQIPRW